MYVVLCIALMMRMLMMAMSLIWVMLVGYDEDYDDSGV